MDLTRIEPSRCTFLKSLPRFDAGKVPPRPMVVVAGRSNVGKSSFINMVLRRKNLARTSQTPGRTQLLNFFAVEEAFLLADVPGYGFAKAPVEVVRSWTENVRDLVAAGDKIAGVLQLLDARRTPSMDDLFFRDLVMKNGRTLLYVVTKIDKLKRSERDRRLADIARTMETDKGTLIATSAETGEGRAAVWARLAELVQAVPSGAGEA